MTGYVAMGSNLGDRGAWLAAGLLGLRDAGLRPSTQSSVWETEPVGMRDAEPFWNMVVQIDAEDSPFAVLDKLQRIERAAGRRRTGIIEPRTLDLDLLLLGETTLDDERLGLPHPRMWERSFVLAPLHEIAPGLRNPGSGRTVEEELARIPCPTPVSRIGMLDRHATVHL